MPQTGGRQPRELMSVSILRVRYDWSIPCFQEKPRVDESECPYRKPTQVGGVRNPRRLGDSSLRNSANCHRNFGRRWAWSGQGTRSRSLTGSQRAGGSDCLPKTQHSAKS